MTVYNLGIDESVYIHGINNKDGAIKASLVIGKRDDYPGDPKNQKLDCESVKENDRIFFGSETSSTIVFHNVESIERMIKELTCLKNTFKNTLEGKNPECSSKPVPPRKPVYRNPNPGF